MPENSPSGSEGGGAYALPTPSMRLKRTGWNGRAPRRALYGRFTFATNFILIAGGSRAELTV